MNAHSWKAKLTRRNRCGRRCERISIASRRRLLQRELPRARFKVALASPDVVDGLEVVLLSNELPGQTNGQIGSVDLACDIPTAGALARRTGTIDEYTSRCTSGLTIDYQHKSERGFAREFPIHIRQLGMQLEPAVTISDSDFSGHQSTSLLICHGSRARPLLFDFRQTTYHQIGISQRIVD